MENDLHKDISEHNLIKEEITIEEDQDLKDVVEQEFYEGDVKLHKCNRCSIVFKKLYHLNQHQVQEHGIDSKFACEKCGKHLMSSFGLKQHLVTHSDEKNFKCDQCDMAFKWSHALSRHKKTMHSTSHSNNRKFKCRDCDKNYKSKADFVKHVKYVHATDKPFQCKVCSKSFAIASSLRKHSFAHSENKPFKCDECPKGYKNQFGLTTHKVVMHATGFLKNESQDLKGVVKQEVHENYGKPYKCNMCLRAFREKRILIYHQANVHGRKGKHACKICGKYCLTPTDLKRHLTKHSDEKNFKCDQCDKSFTRNFGLTLHKRNNHSIKQSFPCEVCSKIFTFASTLKRHFIQTHSEEKRYKCEHCSELFKAPHILAHHLRQVHENAGMFTCDLCNKGFILQSQLKRHLISHSSEKEFDCHKCGKKFKIKYDLTYHLKYFHATERPFQCKDCPKNFATASLLREHVIVHSESRPFQCDECSKAYKTQSHLSTHKIQKHGTGGKWVCKVCGKKYPLLSMLKDHMHAHSNERNFKCVLCPKKFKQKRDVGKHVKKVHKRKTFEHAQVEEGKVKVEPIVIHHESEVTREVLYIKEEIEKEIEVDVKQETEENDDS